MSDSFRASRRERECDPGSIQAGVDQTEELGVRTDQSSVEKKRLQVSAVKVVLPS